MTIRKILVPVAGMLGDVETLEFAWSVAGLTQSHLEALYTQDDPSFMPITGYEDKTIGWMLDNLKTIPQQANEIRDAARLAFRAWAESRGIVLAPLHGGQASQLSARWRECAGSPEQTIADFGRFSDLIVIEKRSGDLGVCTALVGAALFDARRPILLRPQVARKAFEPTAFLGWDASPEAFGALVAALPILTHMRRITLLTIGGGLAGRSIPEEELSDYLNCHGVIAERVTVEADRRSIAARLLDETAIAGAGLLITGAYTHSPAHESLFGGTTLEVLETAQIPVLLAR